YNHLETLSVSISNSLPSTRAATADGAKPTTEASPWRCDHTSLSADIVEVLPVPAGPMTAEIVDAEVNTDRQAAYWSRLSVWPPARRTPSSWVCMSSSAKPWPVVSVAASIRNCS